MDSAKLFFRENPFPATPSSDRYLAIGSVEAARKRLMDAIDRRECPGMLVGPPGTGKSLLCTLIAGAYRNEFDVVLLSESRLCTRKALLQHLLHHLGLPYSDKTEGELRLSLIDRAASGGPANRAGLLIVVDEAHTLPGRLLEELRMMSGIVRSGSPRVQLVLAGGPSLDERFAHPRMEAFSQRISTRCYLHPLGHNETGEYIRGAIRHAGADPQTTIDNEAIAAVYFAADGIPRLINQTMSRAFAMAETEAQQQITAETVQRAWADLQQLPSPVVGHSAAVSETPAESGFAVVEFGTLDEDDREADPMADTVDYEVGVTRSTAAPAAEPELAEPELAEPEVERVSAAEEVERVEDESVEEVSAVDAVDWRPEVVELGNWEPAAADATDVLALFGDDFEEEEPLYLNLAPLSAADVTPLPRENAEIHLSAAASEQRASSDAESTESALHREIVSINAEAVRNQAYREFGEIPLSGDILIADDRDMLVIEDDIEVDARAVGFPPQRARNPAGPAADVDFQSLFTRLREG